MAGDEIQTIQTAEVINGTVNSYTEKKSVTVDGTKYEYSMNYTDAQDAKVTYDLGDKYIVVLDTNGYVLFTDGAEASNNYVYVADVQPTGGVKQDKEADAYFMDGTNKVIVIDNDKKFNNGDKGWFTYDEKNNGKFELNKVAKKITEDKTGVTKNHVITKNGSSSVYYNDTKTFSANTATTFVVNDDGKITVYNGIKNVPDITVNGKNAATVTAVMDGKYAEVVYISCDNLSISGDSGDRVYILSEDYDASVDKDDNKYYEYDAIVNGKIGTIKATTKDLKVGLYMNVSYDEDGYMNDQKKVNNAKDDDFKAYTLKGGKIAYSNGVLTLGKQADLVLADDYKIFLNDDGTGKTGSASKLARDYEKGYTGTIYVFENDKDEAVEIFVMVAEKRENPDSDYNMTSKTLRAATDKTNFAVTFATVDALTANDQIQVTITKKNASEGDALVGTSAMISAQAAKTQDVNTQIAIPGAGNYVAEITVYSASGEVLATGTTATTYIAK